MLYCQLHIKSIMSTRSRKETTTYKKYHRSFHGKKGCVFCEIDSSSDQFVSETNHFKVIDNIFPYSLWDDQDVEDHLMIVPKKHTDTLSDLTPKEAQEYVLTMCSYEKKGYNVWARAPQSSIKSVMHQHTHLIKPGGKTMRFMFYMRKPYFRMRRLTLKNQKIH